MIEGSLPADLEGLVDTEGEVGDGEGLDRPVVGPRRDGRSVDGDRRGLRRNSKGDDRGEGHVDLRALVTGLEDLRLDVALGSRLDGREVGEGVGVGGDDVGEEGDAVVDVEISSGLAVGIGGDEEGEGVETSGGSGELRSLDGGDGATKNVERHKSDGGVEGEVSSSRGH